MAPCVCCLLFFGSAVNVLRGNFIYERIIFRSNFTEVHFPALSDHLLFCITFRPLFLREVQVTGLSAHCHYRICGFAHRKKNDFHFLGEKMTGSKVRDYLKVLIILVVQEV